MNLRAICKTATTIVAILVLIVGNFVIPKECQKITKTCANLIVLNDNIQFYNDSPVKTDAMTAEAKYWMSERQKIYDSQDSVIRTYSRQNALFKGVAGIIAFLAIPAVVILDLVYAYELLIKALKGIERHRQSKKYHNW